MDNKTFITKIGDHFGVYESTDVVELETWTDGGVNMHVVLDVNSKESYYNQFKKYINEFDIDEEIETHRQDSRYKNDFTLRESIEDFEAYQNTLKSILKKLG